MKVAINCDPKEHAKQAILALRTTYLRIFLYIIHVLPSPDQF